MELNRSTSPDPLLAFPVPDPPRNRNIEEEDFPVTDPIPGKPIERIQGEETKQEDFPVTDPI